MTPRTTNQTASLFTEYAYSRCGHEYAADGSSLSLKALYELAGTEPKTNTTLSREEQIAILFPRIAKSQRSKVAHIEATIKSVHQINADCEDVDLMEKTAKNLEDSLSYFKTTEKTDLEIRNQIYQQMYDIYDILDPNSRERQFNVLQKMVKNIKNNDGSFDHNPLNITAKRVEYFMRDISAQKRYTLLLEIGKKTSNPKAYNYSVLTERLAKEYKSQQMIEKIEQKELNQVRYEQIRNKELPVATDNKTKIALYSELLDLVNDQDMGRTHKFNEKKSIYNHLIPLYRSEGMNDQAEMAEADRQKFINAAKISKEASRIKGYKDRF